MEIVLSLNNQIYFRSRQNGHKLLVIRLLNAFQFQVACIALAYSLGTRIVVACVDMAQTTLVSEIRPLLVAHFTINGKKLSRLSRRQTCLRSNELLQFALEAFRIKVLRLLSLRQ